MTVVYHEYSDVWKVEGKYPIAHCVSKNAEMGAGFAGEVTKRYPTVRQMVINSNPYVGDCVVTDIDGKVTFINMVTKRYHKGKPTPFDFKVTVETLCKLGYKEVHMPFIGTGLDKLSKEFVDSVLTDFSEQYGVNIHVHLNLSKDF